MPTTNGRSVMYRNKPSPRTRALINRPSKKPASAAVGAGPFRLLDLPPELRHMILESLVQQGDQMEYFRPATLDNSYHYINPRDLSNRGHTRSRTESTSFSIRNLSLTCLTLYQELADIIYRDVVLDMTHGGGACGVLDRFLVDKNNHHFTNDDDDTDATSRFLPERNLDKNCVTKNKKGKKERDGEDGGKRASSPRIIPRRMYVRNLRLIFHLEDQLGNFVENYAGVLAEMTAAEKGGNNKGRLVSLRIDIDAKWPSCEFWGAGGPVGRRPEGWGEEEEEEEQQQQEELDDFDYSHKILINTGAGGRRKKTMTMPVLVLGPTFQSFLGFLAGSRIPKIGLLVMRVGHSRMWCPYHHHDDWTARSCGGRAAGGANGEGRLFIPVSWKALVKELKGATRVVQLGAGGG